MGTWTVFLHTWLLEEAADARPLPFVAAPSTPSPRKFARHFLCLDRHVTPRHCELGLPARSARFVACSEWTQAGPHRCSHVQHVRPRSSSRTTGEVQMMGQEPLPVSPAVATVPLRASTSRRKIDRRANSRSRWRKVRAFHWMTRWTECVRIGGAQE
jgi:hypothetical protein